ncbi:MAG TPA: hypothetical protein VNC84_03630 [Gammaproteobacteria bacterium]|jgi:hypothetical protein|nr:hypothetical protein [Gammaproteobacteria bacterium]
MPEQPTQGKQSRYLTYIKNIGIYSLSFLGGAAIGLQSCLALFDLIQKLLSIGVALSKAVLALLYGTAILFGGVCSCIANFFLNVELLEGFAERFTTKSMRPLSTWEKIICALGTIAFVIVGVMFTLTVFAFDSTGVIGILGIIAGAFLAILSIPQQVEVWLDSFGKKRDNRSLWKTFVDWNNSLTLGKFTGFVMSVGNSLAFSILLTLGFAVFLTSVAVPLTPALITAFSTAFTLGLFTQFFFFNIYVSPFCDRFSQNIEKFWASHCSPFGLFVCAITGLVNAALFFSSTGLLVGLVASAGIVMPPVGFIIAANIAISASAGFVAFIISVDFWTRNIGRLFPQPAKTVVESTKELKRTPSTSYLREEMQPTNQVPLTNVRPLRSGLTPRHRGINSEYGIERRERVSRTAKVVTRR